MAGTQNSIAGQNKPS